MATIIYTGFQVITKLKVRNTITKPYKYSNSNSTIQLNQCSKAEKPRIQMFVYNILTHTDVVISYVMPMFKVG